MNANVICKMCGFVLGEHAMNEDCPSAKTKFSPDANSFAVFHPDGKGGALEANAEEALPDCRVCGRPHGEHRITTSQCPSGIEDGTESSFAATRYKPKGYTVEVFTAGNTKFSEGFAGYCAICNMLYSAHNNGYCPTTPKPGRHNPETKFVSTESSLKESRSKLRKVTFTRNRVEGEFSEGEGIRERVEKKWVGPGYFHCWSTESEDCGDSGLMHNPAGVVEDEEGRVWVVYAGVIKFNS